MKKSDSRPRNWKGTSESENVATNNQAGHSHAELMIITTPNKMFPYSTKFLLDTHIMIKDNGGKCDTTPHKIGFVKLRDATQDRVCQIKGRHRGRLQAAPG